MRKARSRQRHPACNDVIATTSHILVTCPLAAPAAAWLCRLWGSLDAGLEPPCTPDSIVAGATDGWRPVLHVWTRLRLAYITAAWNAHRTIAQGGASSPTAIAAATQATAVALMHAEYTAATCRPSDLANLAGSLMTGSRQRESRHDDGGTPRDVFRRTWVASGLCTIANGRLINHWTAAAPVPLPIDR